MAAPASAMHETGIAAMQPANGSANSPQHADDDTRAPPMCIIVPGAFDDGSPPHKVSPIKTFLRSTKTFLRYYQTHSQKHS